MKRAAQVSEGVAAASIVVLAYAAWRGWLRNGNLFLSLWRYRKGDACAMTRVGCSCSTERRVIGFNSVLVQICRATDRGAVSFIAVEC